jgi:predicted acyltransferase
MMWVPVPGHGAGVLTREGNLGAYIDRALQGGFYFDGNNTWFLTYMTYTCSVMFGVFAGHILKGGAAPRRKLARFTLLGLGCVGLGYLWDLWFPIIKPLWSSSFVLLNGGFSYLHLALFYLILDVLGFRKWAFPFVVIGSNAILVYSATTLFDFRKIGNIFVGGLSKRLGDYWGLVEASAAFVVVWLLLYGLWRKRVFFKI